MEIIFKIKYHRFVARDLSKISKENKKNIRKFLEDKILVDPENFSRSLKNSPSLLRSAGIGKFRIILKIKSAEISVLGIIHRSNAYKKKGSRKR